MNGVSKIYIGIFFILVYCNILFVNVLYELLYFYDKSKIKINIYVLLKNLFLIWMIFLGGIWVI